MAVGDSIARKICPDREPEVESVPNRHVPSVTDRIETRRCPAGTSKIYHSQAASDPAGLPVEAAVHAAGAGLPDAIEIGTSIGRVRRALGAPDSEGTSTLTYELTLETPNTLTIEQADGRVAAVRWSWYVD